MMEPITFDLINTDDGSIDRARSINVEVTSDPLGDGWIVAFEDSDTVHEVVLKSHDDEGYLAGCWLLDHNGDRTGRCPGWRHHDGPCAHMWAARSKVAAHNLGREGELRADGGRIEAPPAGHDGRTFGRPEAQL